MTQDTKAHWLHNKLTREGRLLKGIGTVDVGMTKARQPASLRHRSTGQTVCGYWWESDSHKNIILHFAVLSGQLREQYSLRALRIRIDVAVVRQAS
jgi:hypothetical protein